MAPTVSRVYPGADGKLVYVAGRTGQHHPRCLPCRVRRRRDSHPDRPGEGNDLAGRGRQQAHIQAAIDKVSALPPRPERLSRHGAAPRRLLPDGHAGHDPGQRHRAARGRHGRHGDRPGRHRHGPAGRHRRTVLPRRLAPGPAAPAGEPGGGRGARAWRWPRRRVPAVPARRRRPGRGGGGFGGGPATLIRIAGAAARCRPETRPNRRSLDDYVPVGGRTLQGGVGAQASSRATP